MPAAVGQPFRPVFLLRRACALVPAVAAACMRTRVLLPAPSYNPFAQLPFLFFPPSTAGLVRAFLAPSLLFCRCAPTRLGVLLKQHANLIIDKAGQLETPVNLPGGSASQAWDVVIRQQHRICPGQAHAMHRTTATILFILEKPVHGGHLKVDAVEVPAESAARCRSEAAAVCPPAAMGRARSAPFRIALCSATIDI